MSTFQLKNTTALATDRLTAIFARGAAGWSVGAVSVAVRYTRSSDFSGACYYAAQRLYVNLGRHLRYPYMMNTHIARTRTVGRRWYRPMYRIELLSAYELAGFIFMHELYHLLVKRAGRNTRQKEGRCDRFATRFMVEAFGTRVLSDKGVPLLRTDWDFQDVEGFVGAARDARTTMPQWKVPSLAKAALKPESARQPRPVRPRGRQLLLFDM